MPGPPGRWAACLYAWEVARRSRAFDAGRGVTRLEIPVVSIGNVSVGGTGKTPMVMWACRHIAEAGGHPCIAMRGYRATHGLSDEAEEYAQALPSVPVVAQPDRLGGLARLRASPEGVGVDAVVLDDGFQHRKIARDCDIVLIDASRPIAAARVLPAGWLREPMESLRRAHAVVLTHAERLDTPAIEHARAEVAASGGTVVAVTEHAWVGLRIGEERVGLDWLTNRRVVAACAIGNPGGFLAALRAHGAEVDGEVVLRDHDPFGASAVRRIVRTARAGAAEAIVVTEKDWSKLQRVPPSAWPCPVARPSLVLRFREGERALAGLLLRAVGRGAAADRIE